MSLHADPPQSLLSPLNGGTLIDGRGLLWLPYDLEQLKDVPQGLRRLSDADGVLSANARPFTLHASESGCLHLINGMGVALGDSVIGLSALHWLRRRRPDIDLRLYRARCSAPHVEEIYGMVSPWLGRPHYLPLPLAQLGQDDTVIDLGDIMYWPRFNDMPMIDFFLWALGLDPDSVPAAEKANRWLARLPLSAVAPKPDVPARYVLFCPRASSALRSLPRTLWRDWVECIWQQYRLPVFGEAEIDHKEYRCIRESMPDTRSFIYWIAGASTVVTVDSAAVHLAAGLDVPTLAFFNTIRPALRMAHYPLCAAFDLRTKALDGLHATNDAVLLADAETAWQAALGAEWPWPVPPT